MRSLIINADDFGYDPAVTRGIAEAMRNGIVTSTTMMVNTPYSEAAARDAGGLAIGLHLNLARWKPVSKAFPAELLRNGEFSEPLAASLPADAVEEETVAQLDRLKSLLGRDATHVDVHKHLHSNAAVLDGVAAAAKARKLPVRSTDAAMRARLATLGVRTNPAFIGDAGHEAYWTLPRLREHLEALAEGVTELMCHPGYSPSEVRSGYAAQREVELETFLHPGARELIEKKGVALANWTAV